MSTNRKALLLTAVTLILVAVFLMFGGGKFIDPVKWIDKFANWGYPAWFVTVTGTIELLGAIGLLIPVLRGPDGIGLAMFMVGAVVTHIVHAEIGMIFVAGAILVASAVVGWLRLPETIDFLRTRRPVHH